MLPAEGVIHPVETPFQDSPYALDAVRMRHSIHEHKKIHAGRGAVGKIAVLGMRERGGRVKGKVLKNTGAEEIQTEVTKSVAPGSILCTDEHGAYRGRRRRLSRMRQFEISPCRPIPVDMKCQDG